MRGLKQMVFTSLLQVPFYDRKLCSSHKQFPCSASQAAHENLMLHYSCLFSFFNC
jgi:hypothetical protein